MTYKISYCNLFYVELLPSYVIWNLAKSRKTMFYPQFRSHINPLSDGIVECCLILHQDYDHKQYKKRSSCLGCGMTGDFVGQILTPISPRRWKIQTRVLEVYLSWYVPTHMLTNLSFSEYTHFEIVFSCHSPTSFHRRTVDFSWHFLIGKFVQNKTFGHFIYFHFDISSWHYPRSMHIIALRDYQARQNVN